MDYVAGYCVAHDVSARDIQLKRNGGQWLLGKTFDTFCPIGPAIVTPDEISGMYFLGDLSIIKGLIVTKGKLFPLFYMNVIIYNCIDTEGLIKDIVYMVSVPKMNV